jgi:putative oxidoreductase
MNIGLLIVRLAAGLLLAGHGTQKAFGWFGGVGFSATSEFLESVGYRPGKVAGLLAVVGELGGGLLLALGLLTPFPAAMVVGVMLNASHVHWPRFWNSAGGFEYPLVLAAVGAGIGFTGPGRISLDQAIGWSLRGNGWGAAAVAVGAGAALLTLVAKHAGPRAMSHEQASSQRDGDDQRAA